MRYPCDLWRFAAFGLILAVYFPAQGQSVPEVETLATRTTGRVTESHPKRVFIGALKGCVVDTQLCEDFDSNLHALLGKAVPGVQFSNTDDVISSLKNRGFLSIDAYQESVLRANVSGLGVDLLVVDDLIWKEAGYVLTSKVIDVGKDKELETFTVKISRSAIDNEEKPILIRDGVDGPYLTVFRGDPKHSPRSTYVNCDNCPSPQYTEEARQKKLEGMVIFVVTVSKQGTAENIGLVKSFDSGLAAIALQTIQRWRFKPAIGLDGKPIATRVPIQVTFQLR